MTAKELLIHGLSAALDNARDKRIRTEDSAAYAFSALFSDVFPGPPESFPVGGYLSEVYDDSVEPAVEVVYTCGELRKPLSELWAGWVQTSPQNDLETYLRESR